MAPSTTKKRKIETTGTKAKPYKKPRKQVPRYTSPSASSHDDDEFPAIDLASASPPPRTSSPTPSAASDRSSESQASSFGFSSTSSNRDNRGSRPTRKRNDPAAFSLSISKILNSKLSTSKRGDPVLARSATAAQANAELTESKLEQRARRVLREEKKFALEKGRVRDVLLGTDAGLGGQIPGDAEGKAAEMSREQEKRLRKTAQRGVVKLFNAVRAAQVKGEEAASQGGAAGRKKERVAEMSKKGFLELVAGGGGGGEKGMEKVIEEA